jgi:nucleotide-binding universal stress UspA family protein
MSGDEAAMNILVPIDGSEYAAAALDAVARRPWPQGTNVRLVHVIPSAALAAAMYAPPPPAMAMATSQTWPAELVEAHARMSEHAQQLLAQAQARLQSAGIAAEIRMREGDARDEIVEEARDFRADLIVMGSHGYTGLKRFLLGSVAQSVLLHAPCSVEIVRTPEQRAAE